MIAVTDIRAAPSTLAIRTSQSLARRLPSMMRKNREKANTQSAMKGTSVMRV